MQVQGLPGYALAVPVGLGARSRGAATGCGPSRSTRLFIKGRLLLQEVPADMSSVAGSGKALRQLLDQRIVVLNGPWGTMLQAAGLGEADYRAEWLRDHPQDVTGDPDLLNLTRPDVVLDIHRTASASSALASIIKLTMFTRTCILVSVNGVNTIMAGGLR